MTIQCDVAVLGGGIGGYSAAIRAAQLGKKVIIIEKDKVGGTCLHRGCIPSKAYLRSAEVYATIKDSDTYGITASDVALDFGKVRGRKEKVVEQLHRGLQSLIRQHKIEVIQGNGRVTGPSIFSPRSGAVAVELPDGEVETIVPANLIIATGSRPRMLPGLKADGQYVLTSDEALTMDALPSSILIVGGGVIGVEWASMLADFGVQVTLIEADKQLLPAEDDDIARELERLLKKRGVRTLTGAKLLVETFRTDNGTVFVEVERGADRLELSAEKLLVSIGRQANVETIGLENTDVRLERGVIRVNEYMQTTESHIYAVGDVNGGLQLAHAAGREGIQAAEHIAGLKPKPIQQHLIARCIYSRPEVASVGITEKQAKADGRQVKSAKVHFKAIGKALVYGESDGFAKVVADRETNDILGVHIIGPHATENITEAALAQILDATPWEVGLMVHPHPTLSEALGDAMLAVDGKALHSI